LELTLVKYFKNTNNLLCNPADPKNNN